MSGKKSGRGMKELTEDDVYQAFDVPPPPQGSINQVESAGSPRGSFETTEHQTATRSSYRSFIQNLGGRGSLDEPTLTRSNSRFTPHSPLLSERITQQEIDAQLRFKWVAWLMLLIGASLSAFAVACASFTFGGFFITLPALVAGSVLAVGALGIISGMIYHHMFYESSTFSSTLGVTTGASILSISLGLMPLTFGVSLAVGIVVTVVGAIIGGGMMTYCSMPPNVDGPGSLTRDEPESVDSADARYEPEGTPRAGLRVRNTQASALPGGKPKDNSPEVSPKDESPKERDTRGRLLSYGTAARGTVWKDPVNAAKSRRSSAATSPGSDSDEAAGLEEPGALHDVPIEGQRDGSPTPEGDDSSEDRRCNIM